LVIGDGEVEGGSVNVRRYGKQESVSLSIAELCANLVAEVKEKK
jgi:threonyl-tRNA synthetase